MARLDHPNWLVGEPLRAVVLKVMQKYPRRSLWMLAGILNSKQASARARAERATSLVQELASRGTEDTRTAVAHYRRLAAELNKLCRHSAPGKSSKMSMEKDFSGMNKLVKTSELDVIVPLQSSLTASLPFEYDEDDPHALGQADNSAARGRSSFNPFPHQLAKISRFRDKIVLMASKQRPKRITIVGNDGVDYMWLCKREDDLRKDQRLLDVMALVNKLLRRDGEAWRRRLAIRTYAVIPMSHETGIIEWVSHMIGLRNVVMPIYKQRKLGVPTSHLKAMSEDRQLDRLVMLRDNILPYYPPVLHEWFLASFPEPAVWLEARAAFMRTTAVMSMLGSVIGLGDRCVPVSPVVCICYCY